MNRKERKIKRIKHEKYVRGFHSSIPVEETKPKSLFDAIHEKGQSSLKSSKGLCHSFYQFISIGE